ncbi:MAG: bifunctional folylpolyglutamate synthase/dihydrofolate synthase [Herpetosiphonaceae bacterium]|nr:bifunctional folylpolyglutamate synthase/dihydrofolate synthase [Herpetosiphonaceae bacterium]
MQTDPGYQAALDYLYSFINYEAKMPPSPEHARFNLARMAGLLAALGQPHEHWPSIVVAGTKGKGSTAAMIEAMLCAGGYRTGFYTSPHLHSWRERVQVNRQLITQSDVVRLMKRLEQQVVVLPAELGPPTMFELATALAFVYFAEQQIDVAVLEIGLGGRYDTVNVVTPKVAVITPISFDHMAVLGNTLTKIAGAKAGIIKPGVPVVSAVQPLEAAAVIRAEAAAQAAPLWIAEAEGLRGPASSTPYQVQPAAELVALRGAHQVENARLALGVIQLLRGAGLQVEPVAMEQGLRTVRWPGRGEILAQHPTILVDGAMNRASAERLREAWRAIPHQRLILVFGALADKDIEGMAEVLVPEAAIVIVTRSRHPRSASETQVASAVAPYLHGASYQTADVSPALELARQFAAPDDLICVTGSLFVAAAAREALGCSEERD